MLQNLSFWIALKYIKSKKRNGFISFISGFSFLGISLGVAVLITVLSVMNGFDKEIKERILIMVPQITVVKYGGEIENWEKLSNTIKQDKNVLAAAPLVNAQAMITKNGINNFGMVLGVSPKDEKNVSPISEKIILGSLDYLQSGKFNIILGKDLANQLQVTIGDKVTIVVPQTNLTPAGVMPRLKRFNVVGIFEVGYQYDSNYSFININDAQKLLEMGNNVSSLQLKVNDIYKAPFIAKNLNDTLLENTYYAAYDWTNSNANFFKALQMEKTMMFLILMLIIAIASFNMLSSLVMIVNDKKSDIAILMTMGFKSSQIMRIFIIQGTVIGVIGIILGTILGIILSLNTTNIVNFVQSFFGVNFLNANVYYINFLPSQLKIEDILQISLIALILSFLATIYPAYKASRIQPAQALRYE